MIVFAAFTNPNSRIEVYVKLDTEDLVPGASSDYYQERAYKALNLAGPPHNVADLLFLDYQGLWTSRDGGERYK